MSDVLVERHGGAAVLTLNAPERRNVLSEAMVGAVRAALDAAEADPGVTCLVLTGAGTAFCAGAELSTLENAADGDFGPVHTVYDGFLRVLESPLPTIAAVNGPAVGAGYNLALACDVRIAGASARFDTRFTGLRLHPGGGHTWLLNRLVGPQHATLACLFGEVWDAETARDRGLVAHVVPDADLLTTAVDLARRLDGLDPEYVRKITATLRYAAAGPTTHADVFTRETEAQEWSLTQPAFHTGLATIKSRIAARKRG
jgi:enoyl-CoA hydratase